MLSAWCRLGTAQLGVDDAPLLERFEMGEVLQQSHRMGESREKNVAFIG